MNSDNLISGMVKLCNNPAMEKVHEIKDWASRKAIFDCMVPVTNMTTYEITACFGKAFPYKGKRYKLAQMIDVKDGEVMAFIFPDEYSFDMRIELREGGKQLFAVTKPA